MKAIGQLFLSTILTVSLFGCGGGNGSSQNTPTPSRDNTPPIITLTGDNPQVIEVGQAYVELGATAADNHDGDLTASITIDASSIDSSVPGSYQVTYDVSDSSGNAAVTVIRSVIYEDRTPPQIFLSSENPQTITQGSPYVELGATATDDVDGDLTNAIVIDDSTVDTSSVGSYEVSYDVEDSSGNAAVTVVRTVNVVAPPPNNAPTANISAPSDLSVYVTGDSIQFTGTGSDTEDGALNGESLVWESDIDGRIGTGTNFSSMTLNAGTHQITVTVTDSSGATDSVTTLIRVSGDSVETYPSADMSKESNLYRVEIFKGGVWVDTHAYQYSRSSDNEGWHFLDFPWVHWSKVGIAPDTTVDVRVTRLNRPFDNDPFSSIEILPSRYGIVTSWDSDTVTFSIEQNQKVYVRANDQDFDTLFIFAVPLQPPVPNGAKYFGPGLHSVGLDYHLLPSEQDVYIDGGAWVVGSIDITDVGHDVRILGPGVLSGEFDVSESLEFLPIAEQIPYVMIHTNFEGDCPLFNVSVEGITIIAGPWWNLLFHCLSVDKFIDNVHIINPWNGSSDGFAIDSNGYISNSFVFNNDDTVKAEHITDGDVSVSDSVFAGRNSFLIGYGWFGSADPWAMTATNIDLILQDNWPCFVGEVDGTGPDIIIDNQEYNDIRIDGPVGRLIYLAIEDTPWGNPGPAQGNVRDLAFNNITLNGRQAIKSIIKGKDSSNRFDNIVFSNLVIDGIPVRNGNKTHYFDIDEVTADVTFISTLDPVVEPDQGRIFGTEGLLDLSIDVWSQSITVGIAGTLIGIQLQFSDMPDPSVALTLSLYSGGNPITGVELTSEQVLLTSTDLDASDIFMWDVTAADLSFDVDDVITLRLQAAQSGYVIAGNDPPGYDGGSLFKNGAPAAELSDIAFITFMLASQ